MPLARMIGQKPCTLFKRAAEQPLLCMISNAIPTLNKYGVPSIKISPKHAKIPRGRTLRYPVWSQLNRYAAGSKPFSDSSLMRCARDFDVAAEALEKHE